MQTYHGRSQSHGLQVNKTNGNGSPVNNLLTNSPLCDRLALYQTLWRNQTANFMAKQSATPNNLNKNQGVSLINRVCQSAGSSRNIASSYPDENGFSSYLRRSRRSDGNDKPEAIYSSPTPKNACNSLLPAAFFPKTVCRTSTVNTSRTKNQKSDDCPRSWPATKQLYCKYCTTRKKNGSPRRWLSCENWKTDSDAAGEYREEGKGVEVTVVRSGTSQ